ncbi:MAG TPA: pantoate--beta-alanine ligase [Chitinophagaceae bacterium]
MIIHKTSISITNYLQNLKETGKSIGFVPTMGALHEGHISLINESLNQNDITVCSIFINPTQFNNKEDFRLYPISIEKDLQLLIQAGCSVLFLPDESEIYSLSYSPVHYPLGRIEQLLEGYYRPGHFQGVSQVVDRLLRIIPADNLYLGQKDYQQCMIIKKLVQIIGKSNEIHICIIPTVREKSGLALSSRNLRLNENEKTLALNLYKELTFIKNNLNNTPVKELKKTAVKRLREAGFVVDYVEVANSETLEPSENTDEHLVALIAATLGKVRLIDNMILN